VVYAKVACYLRICLLYTLIVCMMYQKAAATRAGCYFKGICFSILMYADDIILLAPSISALQHLLDVCESELQYLEAYVYQRQQISLYTRVGSRHAQPCRNLFRLLRMLAKLFGVSPLGT